MTTTIRAWVRRVPRIGGDTMGEHWMTLVYTVTDGQAADPHDTYDIIFSGSHTDAVEKAHDGISRISAQLMDEVHAERASRRETAPVEVQHCRCGHNEWQHQVAGTHCGSFLPGSLKRCWCTHYQPQHVTEDPNTMEATA